MNLDRFWANVIPEPNSGCWLWQGPIFNARRRTMTYGRFGKRNRLAHRVSWEIHFGPPGDKMVCHSCDNVFCVNPDHLFLGDAARNSDDKVAKGRQAKGTAVYKTKLTELQVREIKLSSDHAEMLAARYSVTPGAIYNIRSGLCWSWVRL